MMEVSLANLSIYIGGFCLFAWLVLGAMLMYGKVAPSSLTQEYVLLALLVGLMVIFIPSFFGAVINTTRSIPVGLYWRVRAQPQIGAYVLVCPPSNEVFDAALERGYISSGWCPDGYGLLMKRVAALAGDVVSVQGDGVRVNGELLPLSALRAADPAGRPLPQYAAERYTLAEDEVLLMGDENPLSFDGRYFGPIDRKQIVDVIRPIFTW